MSGESCSGSCRSWGAGLSEEVGRGRELRGVSRCTLRGMGLGIQHIRCGISDVLLFPWLYWERIFLENLQLFLQQLLWTDSSGPVESCRLGVKALLFDIGGLAQQKDARSERKEV